MSQPSSSVEAVPPSQVSPRKRRVWWRNPWLALALILSLLTAFWLPIVLQWQQSLAASSADANLLKVARGDILLSVVEAGSLESANSATVRCKVEAIIGTVGGTSSSMGMGGSGSGMGGSRGGMRQGAGASASGAASGAASMAGGGGGGGGGAARSGASGSGGAASSARASASTGGARSGGGGMSAGGGSAAGSKPVIRSFSYFVSPHVPLRASGVSNLGTRAGAMGSLGSLGGMGGGRSGGGGNRGGGGGDMFMEQPGATRILKILPEGTTVKKGDPVCWLDSSTFEDELKSQLIKHAQAKSWVEQAKASLRVAEIALLEYRDGIFVQDLAQLDKYLTLCRSQYEQQSKNIAWEKEMVEKGLRSPSALKASQLSLEQAEIALQEAITMRDTLLNYSKPKIIKNLEAKIEAVRSDYYAQESAFQFEDERKRKLEKMIENCVLHSPRDGFVVYNNQTTPWGTIAAQIQEGATVRQDQPIFSIPDPSHMRVKARINESKVAFIQPGMPCIVQVDAFPDESFPGRVVSVTPIPAPANGPFSDVRVYYALVDIDASDFAKLRPGLTAEVQFIQNARYDVPCIPLTAIRYLNGQPLVAQPGPKGTQRWVPIQIGLANEAYAEVIAGISPGDTILKDASNVDLPPGTAITPPSVPPPAAAPVAARVRQSPQS
jgi:multidrug resistance efflux pump